MMELTQLLHALYSPLALPHGSWLIVWSSELGILYMSPSLIAALGPSEVPWLHRPIDALLVEPRSAAPLWRHELLPAPSATHHPLSLLGHELTITLLTAPPDVAEQAHMVQSQKMASLGLLAGGVAHDFKNLLIGIIANAQFARDALAQDPAQSSLTDALNDVLLAGRRAGDLIQQMLTYAGRTSSPTAEPISLNALADESLVLLRPSLPPRLSLIRELDAVAPVVLGDGAQLSQLILNLLINAAEAIGDQRGVLTLRSGTTTLDAAALAHATIGAERPRPGAYAFIEIEDNGVGIAPERLPRVFTPFFSDKPNGRGLGLAVVHAAVRAHGGVLFVESTPGHGTRIRACLPAHQAEPLHRPPTPSDTFEALPPAARRRHVVVVDDEPVVRSLAQRIFERYQIPLLLCSSGAELLELLDAHHEQIALVLLDYNMPGMSGIDALDALRPRFPDLPVFLSSGFEIAHMPSIDEAPHTRFISKPYTPSSLMRQLKPILEAE
jgi:signal transduction histidine kinase/CheY-like chemotaxis protein